MACVLILGATSAIAEQFANAYATPENKIILVARNKQKLDEIKNNLLTRGGADVNRIVFDFVQMDSTQDLVDDVYQLTNKIDVLLLAYGTLPDQAQSEKDILMARREFEINGLSPVLVLMAFAEKMRVSQSGTIVAISSVAGDRGRQSNYLYGSAKSSLTSFLSGLRNALTKDNVHVITVKPGFVDTPMTKDFDKGFLWAKPKKVALDIKSAIEKRKNIIYTPWFWRWIMLIIKHIPEPVFKRMKL